MFTVNIQDVSGFDFGLVIDQRIAPDIALDLATIDMPAPSLFQLAKQTAIRHIDR